MKLILTYGIPFLLIILGGQAGTKGTIVGVLLAIAYLILINLRVICLVNGSKALKKGDTAKGIELYKKAMKGRIDAEYVVYASYVFLRYGYEKECADTIKKAEAIKNLSPKQKKELTITKALLAWRNKNFAEAEELIKEVHEKMPDSTTYAHLGFIYLEEGKFDEAYEFNKEALEYNDSDASILDNMAMSHYHKGEIDEAIALYDKIFESTIRFPVIYYNYALCLIKKGEKEKAIDALNDALHYPFSHIAAVSKDEVMKKLDEIKE